MVVCCSHDEDMLPQIPDRPSSAAEVTRPKPTETVQQDPHNGYGSAEAAEAAERLLQLGVSVNPPGKHGAIDWGALAGVVQILLLLLLLLQIFLKTEAFNLQRTACHASFLNSWACYAT